MFRGLDKMPVLVKAGGVLPMNGEECPGNGTELPEHIMVRVYPEADGETVLIEDNGKLPADPDYRRTVTKICIRRENGLAVEICSPEGDTCLLPANRRYTVELNGVADTKPDCCDCDYTSAYNTGRRTLSIKPQKASCCLKWNSFPEPEMPDKEALIREILQKTQISYDLKAEVLQTVRKHADPAELMAELHIMPLPKALLGAVLEILTAF